MYEQPASGAIAIFSLKNPSHPEFTCWASSGVNCIDFHPQVEAAAALVWTDM